MGSINATMMDAMNGIPVRLRKISVSDSDNLHGMGHYFTLLFRVWILDSWKFGIRVLLFFYRVKGTEPKDVKCPCYPRVTDAMHGCIDESSGCLCIRLPAWEAWG
jgi:hypothetical protein